MGTALLVGADPAALGSELVARIGAIARDAVKDRGVFNVAVSGGSMPKTLAGLAGADLDWSKCKIFFADERCVPLDHDDSNHKAWEAFFKASVISAENIVAVRTNLDPQGAADDYEARLKEAFASRGDDGADDSGIPRFDAALLGFGPDGHTCSLFPSHALLDERSKWVAHIENSPKPPPQRITFTYPVLENSRNVMFIGTGAGKASLLPQLLRVVDGKLESVGPSSPYPAARLGLVHGSLVWCVDKAAASECSPEIMTLAQEC